MEDNQEIGACMFRRTVPAVHLTSEDVRWMVSFSVVCCYFMYEEKYATTMLDTVLSACWCFWIVLLLCLNKWPNYCTFS